MPTPPDADLGVTIDLVTTLIGQQCPHWSALPLAPFAHGWDNETFALGDDLLVRVPRRGVAVALLRHEQRWLPELAGRLPVRTPVPVWVGAPSASFPHPWSVVPRLPGRVLAGLGIDERGTAVDGLAATFAALHVPAPGNAPDNPFRGGPLAGRDPIVRQRLRQLPGFGTEAVELWTRWASAPPYPGPPLWLHGDPHPLNVLVDDAGRLAGLLDWGDVTAGDPASDLATLWLSFGPADRARLIEACRAVGDHDPAVWTRARAWALALASAFAASGDPALAPVAAHTWAQLRAQS